jgi:hypothetical protein
LEILISLFLFMVSSTPFAESSNGTLGDDELGENYVILNAPVLTYPERRRDEMATTTGLGHWVIANTQSGVSGESNVNA